MMEVDTCFNDGLDLDIEHESLTLRAEGEEDEDEDEDLDVADTEHDVHAKRTLSNCLKSRPCYACIYFIIILLLLASAVSIVVVSIVIIGPYHRASTFLSVSCQPLLTIRDEADRHCSCGKGCHSHYPCVRVMVKLYPFTTYVPDNIDRDMNPWLAVLTEDESMLEREASITVDHIANNKSEKL